MPCEAAVATDEQQHNIENHTSDNSLPLQSDSFSFIPSNRGFKIACLNVRSLLAHMDELRVLLADNPIDVLAINETWLDSTKSDEEAHISGYRIKRRDRADGQFDDDGESRGGVCFYIRENINFSLRPDLSVDQLENFCLEIRKPSCKPFLLITMYRPPSSTVDKFDLLETLIGKLDAENVEYWLLGDLNCNLGAPTLDHKSRILSGIADLYNLEQLIDEPTRITESSSTMIDLIFTNTPDNVACSGVSHVGISDHSLIYAFRKLSTGLSNKAHKTITYRNFKKFDQASFRADISSQNWEDLKSFDDPNDMWHAWKANFNRIVDKHAPLCVKRVRASKSPWITTLLMRRMHERDIQKIKAIRSKDPVDWAVFKKLRNSVNNEIKLAKESYYKNAFYENEKNPRKTWNIINELTSRKRNEQHINEVKLDEITISDSLKISEEFNNHFASIGPKLAKEIAVCENGRSFLDYLTCKPPNTRFDLRPINCSTVLSVLSKLCKSKATGLDKISARLLRECPDLIAEPLCAIFNRSIETGIFPDEWKCAKVLPLYKHGEHRDMNNYRPISIIPVVAKVFERIIYEQVCAFLTNNGILSNYQSGFRCLHSTVTALLEATNDWAYNIDRGNVNSVVFLDLKKAFDTVNHSILLSKLNAYGFGCSTSNWFASYLDCRSQKCFVNGHLSDYRTLLCGIPQGTILGPLLFLVYINDLPNCLEHSKPRMYADDTHLTFASNNVEDITVFLNQDLANVSEWLVANMLTLNQSKTEFMLIGSRQRLSTFNSAPSLALGGVPIKQVPHTKSLGVHIDENLSWSEHIHKLTKKNCIWHRSPETYQTICPDYDIAIHIKFSDSTPF